MGLPERRAIEKFRTDDFPGWKARIDDTAGFDVPVEVAWDTLAVDGYADSYREFVPKVFFQPLVGALAAIAIDDIGRDALRAGLQKVVIKNSNQYYSANGFGFDAGVLTIDLQTESNVDYVEERETGLRKLLEEQL